MQDDQRQLSKEEETSRADEAIERLLRLAGPRPAIPAERIERIHSAVHEAWRDAVRARSVRRRMTIGTLGLAAAAVLLLALFLRPADKGAPVPPAPAAHVVAMTGPVSDISTPATALREGAVVRVGASIRTGTGGLAALALADGGELRLDGGTVVHLEQARTLRLDQGAIYVDSGGAFGALALTVRTPLGVLRDVGTRFEVRLVDRALRIRVRDGEVRYDRSGVSHAAAAGAELVVGSEGAVQRRTAAPFGPDWTWIVRAAPAFRVEGRTLAAFLNWVDHESGRTVELADATLQRTASQTILHGSVDGLTPDEALAVILPTCGLAHRLDGSRVIVFRPTASGGEHL